MSKIPIFRFRTLLFTTISKPIARKFDAYSRSSPYIREKFYSIGKVADNVSFKVHQIAKPEYEKKEYEKERIVEIGSEVMSEMLLLSIFGFGLYKYYHNRQKEKREMNNKIDDLTTKVNKLTKQNKIKYDHIKYSTR